MIWNLFSFKGAFSFGKSQKLQGAKSGLYGGWVTWVIWCFAKNCRRCKAWVGALSWWRCQLPVAHSYGLLNYLNSFHGGIYSSLMQNSMQICCSTCSVILNATQYTCPVNGVYHPHWLVQWSHHCSHVRIPVHSPCLPRYVDVKQTVLILAMVGLFPDLPCIYMFEMASRCSEYISPGTDIELSHMTCFGKWGFIRSVWENSLNVLMYLSLLFCSSIIAIWRTFSR